MLDPTFHLVMVVTIGREWTTRSYALGSSLLLSVTFSLLGPNILHSTLFHVIQIYILL